MDSHYAKRTRGGLAALASLALVTCLLAPSPARPEPITMTVLYDNTVYVQGTTADWGFACMIEGGERTILFDTGNNGNILLANIAALQLDLSAVEDIVLSHNHYDHVNGLNDVLAIHGQVNVYLGDSFPTSFEQMIINYGAIPIPVSDPVEICHLVHSTGEITGAPVEQSLIIEAAEGLVIITGCAHPGIVQILQRAQEVVPGNIYLVIGGFHLLNATAPQIQQIVSSFQALGVENVGPTHCTGDLAIQLFQQAYGANCITLGTAERSWFRRPWPWNLAQRCRQFRSSIPRPRTPSILARRSLTQCRRPVRYACRCSICAGGWCGRWSTSRCLRVVTKCAGMAGTVMVVNRRARYTCLD